MWWWGGQYLRQRGAVCRWRAPTRPAGQVSREECQRLAAAIRATLLRAIEAGGSTLRDFTDAIGKPGYFQQHYAVCGRDGLPCHACATWCNTLAWGSAPVFTARIVKPDPTPSATRPTHTVALPVRPWRLHPLKPACAGRAVVGAHPLSAFAGGATPRRATRLVRKPPRTLNIHHAHGQPPTALYLANTPLVANQPGWIFCSEQRYPHPALSPKAKIRRWPLIGPWSPARRHRFILKRGKRRDAARINQHTAKAMQDDDQHRVIPEGTTPTDAACGHSKPVVRRRRPRRRHRAAGDYDPALYNADGSISQAASYVGDTTPL